MTKKFKFIAFVRNSEYPLSDSFKMVVHVKNLEMAQAFFAFNGCYVCPNDLAFFVSPRQLARLKTFYNKPRHFDLFSLDVISYKALD